MTFSWFIAAVSLYVSKDINSFLKRIVCRVFFLSLHCVCFPQVPSSCLFILVSGLILEAFLKCLVVLVCVFILKAEAPNIDLTAYFWSLSIVLTSFTVGYLFVLFFQAATHPFHWQKPPNSVAMVIFSWAGWFLQRIFQFCAGWGRWGGWRGRGGGRAVV